VSLHQDRLEEARAATVAALRRPDREHEPSLRVLHGLIVFHLGDRTAARSAFGEALHLTGLAPDRKRRDLDRLYARGLALSGLTLCGEAHRASEAAVTYQEVNSLGQESQGLLYRNRRLLDALDREKVLGASRRALAMT